MMLLDWWKSDFKKKGRFKKKNKRGKKINGEGEKMISELPSCLKLKKCDGSSKGILIRQTICHPILHNRAVTEVVQF